MSPTVVEQTACPSCDSSDAYTVYDDGHAWCFSCQNYFEADGTQRDDSDSRRAARADLSGFEGETKAVTARKLSAETCEKWDYRLGTYRGRAAQVANFYEPGTRKWVAAKLRFPGKDFQAVGDTKALGKMLFGQHLWRDSGKMVVVTEGEVDAMSVSQLQKHKYAVVSVPAGAQGSHKAVAAQLEWLERFERVVFMFDADEPGREGARRCAELLTPGKAHIAELPLKDANECLKAGRGKEVLDAMWGARPYRPDGIIDGADLWSEVTKPIAGAGIPWWHGGLQEKFMGVRPGELITVVAGPGAGKSTFLRQTAAILGTTHKQTVGYLGLEENVRLTALGIMGAHAGRRWTTDFRQFTELSNAEQQERRAAFEATLGTGRFFVYDHFGSTDVDNLLSRVRYMARGLQARFVILDHLSIVVSGMEDDSGLDERRLIDKAMTRLRTLVEEANIGLFLVVHLRRPGDGRGWDTGRQISLQDLRGSSAIEGLSDGVIALERDLQDPAGLVTVRALKNRAIGLTGEAGYMRYDRETGLCHEVTADELQLLQAAADETADRADNFDF